MSAIPSATSAPKPNSEPEKTGIKSSLKGIYDDLTELHARSIHDGCQSTCPKAYYREIERCPKPDPDDPSGKIYKQCVQKTINPCMQWCFSDYKFSQLN